MKRLIDKICFAITIGVFLVIAFIMGGFVESMKHPEIVREQSITLKELASEIRKRNEPTLQIDNEWSMKIKNDNRHAACIDFVRDKRWKNPSIAGAGDNTLQSGAIEKGK